MKIKMLLLLLVIVTLSCNNVQAKSRYYKGNIQKNYNIENITNSRKIYDALKILEYYNYNDTLNYINKKKVTILFWNFDKLKVNDNLKEKDKKMIIEKFSTDNNRYYLISEEFKNSTPEFLACLIRYQASKRLSTLTVSEQANALNNTLDIYLKVKQNIIYDNSFTNTLDEIIIYHNNIKELKEYVKRTGFNVILGN